MKDEELDRMLKEVEEIMKTLESGEASLEEGRKLRDKSLNLLESAERLLNVGGGKTFVLECNGDKIVKEELKL